MSAPTIVELFAGIAGFGLGFERAGFESSVQAEISKPCRELLAAKFPNCQLAHDVTILPAIYRHLTQGYPINEHWQNIIKLLRAATVWCGGFPCQDLSVAGQRAGLAGERSGLWFVFRRLVALFRPAWVVIENVPGLLSSNGGRDVATIFSGLEKLGYRWAYRTLDAQYFGLAQRRERVFIVASLGNFSCAEILFERESLCWDSPPSRETGKRITGTLSARSEAGGGLGSDFEIGGGLVESTLSARQQQPQSGQSDVHSRQHVPQRTGGAGRYDGESETFIAHTLRGEGFDASEDGTGRGTPIIACQIAANATVRRLTPTECERLQGFPDGWTEGFSDSARYRMLGNAVAVPCAEWIARRMAAKIIPK